MQNHFTCCTTQLKLDKMARNLASMPRAHASLNQVSSPDCASILVLADSMCKGLNLEGCDMYVMPGVNGFVVERLLRMGLIPDNRHISTYDVCVLFVGSNDLDSDFGAAAVMDRYTSLDKFCKTHNVILHVVCPLLRRRDSKEPESHPNSQTKQLRELLENQDTISALTSIYYRFQEGGTQIATLFRDDGVHLTKRGRYVLEDQLQKFIGGFASFKPLQGLVKVEGFRKLLNNCHFEFFKGVHCQFSNFFACSIYDSVTGLTYPSAEHMFQAIMAFSEGTPESAKAVQQLKTPVQAKHYVKRLPNYRSHEYNKNQVTVMFHVLLAKFTQNSELKKALCETNNAILAESGPPNRWTYGGGKGTNLLGLIMMCVRDILMGVDK